MEKIKQIRERINKEEKHSSTLSFLQILMVILSIILGVLIYMKKDANGTFLYENFGISVNFDNFNSNVNQKINSLFDFSIFNKENIDQTVSTPIMYIEKENNNFYCENQNIKMLNDGTILGVYDNDGTYSILISYDNEVLASYSNLKEVSVKPYDNLVKGEVFATYIDSFVALFKKDNQIIKYNEAI